MPVATVSAWSELTLCALSASGVRKVGMALLYVLAALFEPVVVLAGEVRVVEGDPLVIGGESIRLS